MLRKHCNRWLLIVVLALMLGACIPYSFSPPKECILILETAYRGTIAVDTEGVSHIVGVETPIVYYRTHYGEPIITQLYDERIWDNKHQSRHRRNGLRMLISGLVKRGGGLKNLPVIAISLISPRRMDKDTVIA